MRSIVLKYFGGFSPFLLLLFKSVYLIQGREDFSAYFLEKKVDFLFTVKDSIVKLPNTEYQELHKGKFVCVVPKSYECSGKKAITFQDLAHRNLILLHPSDCPNEMLEMEKKIISQCPLSPVLYSDNQLSGCTMAKCGVGIAIMPDFICILDPELCIIPLETDDFVPYGVVWNKKDRRKETYDLLMTSKEVYGQ